MGCRGGGGYAVAKVNVTLDGASGQVRLRAPSGTIDATGLRSADVEATVPAGSGPYRVEARSEPGRTTVAVRSDPAASSTITASSDNGHVVVREA
jgi:hypothetical protein